MKDLKINFSIILLIFFVGCMPYYNKIQNYKMKNVKIELTVFFNENSLTITPDSDYEIYEGNRLKGNLIKGEEYKFGIYCGKRVVIAKQKIYDAEIYLKSLGESFLTINNKNYRGNFIIKIQNNKFVVINDINIEKYLYSVLGVEMSHKWNIEALKAQAVVARTYTLNSVSHRHEGFDLCDNVHCQVYNGMSSESSETINAVEQTYGELVTDIYSNISLVYYHSCCGGHTESSRIWNLDSDVLRGVKCKYCKESPFFKWKAFLSYQEISEKLKIKEIEKISIRRFSKSGRIKDLTIYSPNNSLQISCIELRKIFYNKIKSTFFSLENKSDGIFMEGYGYGHGVGMCQYGAKTMADKGYNYKEIIRHYFKGSEIRRCMD